MYSSYSSSGDLTDAQAQALFGALAIYYVFAFILAVIMIVALWKLFTKAGKPGWAAIVPFYNIIVWLEIIGRPMWWIVLMFVPFVNIVVALLIYFDLAKAYGKGAGFGLGLVLLPYIFLPILAFGSSVYVGPGGAPAMNAYAPQQGYAPAAPVAQQPYYPPAAPPVQQPYYPPAAPPAPPAAPPAPPAPPSAPTE